VLRQELRLDLELNLQNLQQRVPQAPYLYEYWQGRVPAPMEQSGCLPWWVEWQVVPKGCRTIEPVRCCGTRRHLESASGYRASMPPGTIRVPVDAGGKSSTCLTRKVAEHHEVMQQGALAVC